jgi:hypothetical protein
VRATLIWLRDKAEIREIMAERRKARGVPLTVEVIEHEESCEVRFSDGRQSVYFYHDDDAGRHLINGRDTPAKRARSCAIFSSGWLRRAWPPASSKAKGSRWMQA